MMSRFVRPKEASAETGVTDSTIYNWIRRGVLPAVRIGGTLLIPRDAFERVLSGELARQEPVGA